MVVSTMFMWIKDTKLMIVPITILKFVCSQHGSFELNGDTEIFPFSRWKFTV